MTFDEQQFLDWLDDQEGPITMTTMDEQWPEFPWQYMDYNTGPIVKGDCAYYKHDLRLAAKKRQNPD
jgi:hypothetical protein